MICNFHFPLLAMAHCIANLIYEALFFCFYVIGILLMSVFIGNSQREREREKKKNNQ